MTKQDLKESLKKEVMAIAAKGFEVIDALPDRNDGIEWNEIDVHSLLRKCVGFDNIPVDKLVEMMLLSDKGHYPGENKQPVYLTQEEIDKNEEAVRE